MADRQEDFLSQALALEESIDSMPSGSAKLKAAIESAELYMQALRITKDPEDRKVIDSKCKELIERGTHLKLGQDAAPRRSTTIYPVSMRKLTTRENIIILEGSKLNGFVFKPWDRPPLQDEFALESIDKPFVDSKPLPLSQTQLEAFGGWKRPKDALALVEIVKNGHSLSNEPTMAFPDKVDLVQDLTSDCSVVASLCAGTSRIERGHAKASLPASERLTYQFYRSPALSCTLTTTKLRPSFCLRMANTSSGFTSMAVGDESRSMILCLPP